MNARLDDNVVYAYATIYATGPGWSVIPIHWVTNNGTCSCGRSDCKSVGKHPLTRQGSHDGTTNMDTITGWWTRWPNANLGICTGLSNLVAIDVDPRHDGTDTFNVIQTYAATKNVDLTNTLAATTGSHGKHYLYQAPTEGRQISNGQGSPFGPDAPGVDIRARGGYIVASPSTHVSGGTYQWDNFATHDPAPWPDLLTRLLYPPKPAHVPAPRPQGEISSAYAQTALDGELHILATTGEGNRNNQLNVAAVKLGGLVGAGLLDYRTVGNALWDVARQIGLDSVEATRTIRSGLDHGVKTPRTVTR